MAPPLILARTFKDAHAYAKDVLGLSHGYYRVVNSPGTIKACRNVDIHLVPGWDKRPDRFTMKGALRYCRLRIIDVAEQRKADAEFEAIASSTPAVDESGQDVVGHFFADLFFPAEDPKPTDESLVSVITEGEHQTEASLVAAATAEIAADLPEPADAVEATEEPAPAPEKPKAKRRTRCKDCEQLHFKGDPCIESEDS